MICSCYYATCEGLDYQTRQKHHFPLPTTGNLQVFKDFILVEDGLKLDYGFWYRLWKW